MYYRNPDYLNVEQLAKMFRARAAEPSNWHWSVVYSALLFAVPAALFFLAFVSG